MKILTPGHQYELSNVESGSQNIQFVEKIDRVNELANFIDGTTNEEVIAMLIDRMRYLQTQLPCFENALTIQCLEVAMIWLEKRTADRVARKVEGTHKQ